MSCNTNEKSIDLPPSINLLTPAEPLTESDDLIRETCCSVDDNEDDGEDDVEDDAQNCPSAAADECQRELATKRADVVVGHHKPKLSITMPSSHVIEISQNFYWPLYSKPIDWILQDHLSRHGNSTELESRVRKVAEELHSLEFFQAPQVHKDATENNDTVIENDAQVSDAASAEATILRIMAELQQEKEDWFSDLSGGQKSKVELVRSVFLRDQCPDVLLVDETMAPLDPSSKELVMTKLKLFCSNSIILVIYHTDVGQGKEINGKKVDCVPSNDFFNKNIHLANGIVHLREIC
jgi:ABC-type transport system involved in cytochrome c biogenesis ATPase subunit